MSAGSPVVVASSTVTTPNLGSPVAIGSKDEGGQASQLVIEREKKRQILRASNLRVWQQGPTIPSKALDSNLKKNTAFVKRVKQSLGVDAKEQLKRDLGTLNLDKYLEELIQAVPEGLARCANPKDCLAAAETLSAFHARFGGQAFSTPLTQLLTAALGPPNKAALQATPQEQRERDETARVAKQKTLFRVTAELALVEVVGHTKEHDGAAWLYQTIKNLLSSDREHLNVPILITFLKALGSSLLDIPTADHKGNDIIKDVGSMTLSDAASGALAQLDTIDPGSAPLVQLELKIKFRKLFETYFSTLSRRISKEHFKLQEQDRKNHEAYIRSGEIFEDRQQTYEKMTKSFEKVHEWGKALSELLGVPMPTLTDANKSNAISLGVNLDSKSAFQGERDDEGFANYQSPWEDEDTRKFYLDLLDLSDILPSSILNQQGASGKEEGAREEEAAASEQSEPSKLVSDAEAKSTAADGQDDQMSAGPAAQLNSLLAKLPDMTNRAMIDSAAVDFAFISSKVARRRLIKHLATIPRNRLDLIPYYARLIATLNRYMPDVGTGLIALLDDEFRYFQRKRNTDLTESRAKNACFIAELAKFKVTPSHTIFHCLKVCLEDFAGPNIDILATFLETCGRFLLRTEETGAKMRTMLEILRRKRAVINLDARQLLMLDNAYYQCNPPERKAIEQKVRTPMDLYIQHLIYDVLAKQALDDVLKLLRKLHWEDSETVSRLKALFTRVWRMKFSNIHLLAILVYDLQTYHSDFAISIIDQVCENIRVGLEQNIFKHNQRRVATVKYLGELYNYRLVNSSIIFDQLWSFSTFGHPSGRPLPHQTTPLDAPDDYFRIRLICTLLDTCGVCFDRGSLKKKLDEYLIFLNLYLLCKEQPLPMEIEFMLSDTLETLRPKFKLKQDFVEAATAVDEMFTEHRAKNAAAEEDDEDDEDESDEEEELSGQEGPRGRSTRSGGDSTAVSQFGDVEDEDESDDSDDAEDDAINRRREEEAAFKKEVDDEFDRELAKMMADSAASSGGAGGYKKQTKGLFDVGLPIIKRSNNASGSSAEEEEQDVAHMQFSLLSKKGNKQTTHQLRVPTTSAIAINTRNKQLKEKAERRQLKEIVLAYEGREEVADRNSLEQTLGRKGFKVKFADGSNS